MTIRHSMLMLTAAAMSVASLAACQSLQCAAPFSQTPDAHPTTQSPPQAYVRYFPERVDDIAWENDRTAFRIYGPELETAAPPLSSGIDAWAKNVRHPVINAWYQAGEHFYHYDHGEGADCYKTGNSRGDGGIGIWNESEKKLYVSHDWGTFSILNRGPKEAKFQVTYAPWRVTTPKEPVGNAGAPGRKVWQVTTVTLPMGTNFNRFETTLYSNEPGDLTVAVGVATHGAADGKLTVDGQNRMSWWDKSDAAPDDKNDNGFMGAAVIVNPAQVVGRTAIDSDNLLLLKVTPGKPFVYYAGACWSKGLDFHTQQQWNEYVNNYPVMFSGK